MTNPWTPVWQTGTRAMTDHEGRPPSSVTLFFDLFDPHEIPRDIVAIFD